MKVGIAGAGAIAMGYAAFLLKSGHQPVLWSPSGRLNAGVTGDAPLRVSGAIEGEFYPLICNGVEHLAKCDVIVVALPANGYRMVLDSLVPIIEPRHSIIISGHLSFAALYLSKKLAERGIEIPIAAWNTTILTSKAQSAYQIKVGTIRSKVDMATIPSRLSETAKATCCALFGERFIVKDDILAIALSNLNPQNHMATVLCNLTRVERGESWGQRSNITNLVGRLIEALDLERLAVAAACGKTVRTVFEHYALSFNVEANSVAEIASKLVASGKDPAGPKAPDTRYILEDVPFGLTPMLYLAQICSVETPLHRSGADLLSACYGRDLSMDNDLLPELGTMDLNRIVELSRVGYSS